MFDLPEAKCVRRDEILSRASSQSPSPPPAESTFQDGHQRLGELLNLDTFATLHDKETGQTTGNQKQNEGAEDEEEDEEQEFEFRLFSTPVARKPSDDPATGVDSQKKKPSEDDNGGTQKLRIRLRSPTPGPADLSEGRFVNPSRGWQYNFTAPGLLSGSKTADEDEDEDAALKRKQFEEVAVSGQHMLGWARLQAWPGCHLPWRVIRLNRQHTKLPPASKDPTTSTQPIVCVGDPPETSPRSRKKPGKKRRVQLRKRLTAAGAAKEAEAEKRNRKNRERKIKRRQKAREMKAAAVAASGGNPDAVMAGVDDASSQGGDD